MSVEELRTILRWIDVKTLKDALAAELVHDPVKMISIVQAIHGRMYNIIKGT